MNIIYFCDTIAASGGLDRIVISKANYLAKKHKVIIVTSSQHKKEYFYPLSTNVKHIDFSDYGQTKNILLSKTIFQKIINDIKPDIIISPTGKESFVLPFFDKKTPKIKEMHFAREYRTIHHKNTFFLKRIMIKILDMIELKIFAKYDAVCPLTYEDEKRWQLNNTQVIYNFKSFEVNRVSSCEEKRVMAVGRLEHEKGFDMLLKSWSLVLKKRDDWQLHIYGDGSLKNDLILLARELGIEKNVHFEGNVSAIKDEYLKSSIFVMSSRHEGMPLSLVEAMSCGLPVVSFACPSGPREMIKNGYNGFVIENEDIVELADKLLHLMSNINVRKIMGNNARKSSETYDKNKIMKKWEDLFVNIINKKRRIK